MLVVQVVEILWTKATRGAPRANERAALPRAFPLEVGTAECIVQRHRMIEWEGFVPEFIEPERLPNVPGSIDVLRIRPEKGGVFVLGMLATPNTGSQPKRRAIHDAMHLLPGQWARLVVNSRYTSSRGQHYTERIFNVASGIQVPRDRFMLDPPDHALDMKANLF
jgi:hypothetical protein